MDKKLQGRKGRPSEGPQRKFRCSDEKWATILLAAVVAETTASDIIRDGSVALAIETLRMHVETLRTIELDDPLLKETAKRYLEQFEGQ